MTDKELLYKYKYMTDKELVYEYKMQVLRREHIKGLFDCGYLYNVDVEAICKNIAKLEQLILGRMSSTKATNKECING